MTVDVVILIPVLTGIIEVIKRADIIPSRFMSFIALILGIIMGYLFMGEAPMSLLIGAMIGLSAVGLFEGIKMGGVEIQKNINNNKK